MACHELIDHELRILARRLPAPVVEELADGLAETYQTLLTRLGDPGAAAKATLAQFGDADTVSAAFVRAAPGRAAARLLLITGPLVGVVWATVLVTTQAWSWPAPIQARLAVGAALGIVVLALALTVRTTYHYKAVQVGALSGACGLLLLDVTALAGASALAVPSFLIACALAVSLARIVLVAQMLLRFR
ncbi:hypothetical protein [Microtetraspora malaysiensis]|uniref:hypothetical protein n=1 Tax=Microtetraspora malaysiensis TaxID=161358 RepID=UPI00082FA928|nr:hypothetical protein [Microtetraspora malaysiensis]